MAGDKKKYTGGEKAKVALMWMLMTGFCVMNIMVKIGFPPFFRFIPQSIPLTCCFIWCVLATAMPYYYKTT